MQCGLRNTTPQASLNLCFYLYHVYVVDVIVVLFDVNCAGLSDTVVAYRVLALQSLTSTSYGPTSTKHVISLHLMQMASQVKYTDQNK